MTTPNLGLPELVANQSQPHVPINQAARILDTLVQMVAIDILTAPPGGTPDDGNTYLVDTGATGAWAGFDEYLVYWQTNAWQFIQPKIGWRCYLASVGQDYRFSLGSPNGWAPIAEGGGGDGGGGGGVSRLADLEDVDLANLHDGYALVWNETDGKFEFVSIAAGGTINITDLADVLPGSPGFADGDTLVWDATLGKFIPKVAGSGGAGDAIVSSILLHFDGANGDTTTVDDGVGGFPVTVRGTATLSTTQKKFGATSLQCTATGGVSIPLADFTLSDPGFSYSIDMWIYPTVNADSTLIGQWASGGLSWLLAYVSGSFVFFYADGTSHFPTWSVAWTLNTWQHVAISRINDWLLLYVNGTYQGKLALSTGSILTTPVCDLTIGYSPTSAPNTGNTNGFTGFIDELRIVKGHALFNQTFTPPTAAYDQ